MKEATKLFVKKLSILLLPILVAIIVTVAVSGDVLSNSADSANTPGSGCHRP